MSEPAVSSPEPSPDRAADDSDRGWGDDATGDSRDDDERLMRERPPHW